MSYLEWQTAPPSVRPASQSIPGASVATRGSVKSSSRRADCQDEEDDKGKRSLAMHCLDSRDIIKKEGEECSLWMVLAVM